MAQPQLILMPGMDGTGLLFRPLLAALRALRPDLSARALSYPMEELDYEALQTRLAPEIADLGPHVLVAESFSGPLALRLAGPQTRGVVLAATFVRTPVDARLESLVRPAMFELRFHGPALRAMLVGWDASAELVEEVAATITSVPASVLAHRLRAILRVDARPDLERLKAPLVYLHAERDRTLGASALRDLLAQRPELEVHRLDAPHLALQTRAEDCARLLVELVERWR